MLELSRVWAGLGKVYAKPHDWPSYVLSDGRVLRLSKWTRVWLGVVWGGASKELWYAPACLVGSPIKRFRLNPRLFVCSLVLFDNRYWLWVCIVWQLCFYRYWTGHKSGLQNRLQFSGRLGHWFLNANLHLDVMSPNPLYCAHGRGSSCVQVFLH